MRKTITMKELRFFVKTWMILNEARMPKGIYDSFREISPDFGFVSKTAMFVDILEDSGVDEYEASRGPLGTWWTSLS
jgi:hypothetical protein